MHRHAAGESDFQRAVDRAVCDLVQREHFFGVSVVSLPTSYDSGAATIIRVEPRASGVRVTDGALGYIEAEAVGIEASYAHYASRQATAVGASYNASEIFIEGVAYESIAVAVNTVAHASLSAFGAAWERMLSAKETEDHEAIVIDRLRSVFSPQNVEVKPTIRGARKANWRATALVHWQGRDAVFQTVSPASQSWSQAVAKFWDLEQLPSAPIRVATVPSIAQMGESFGLLSSIATVLEEGAEDRDYIRAAVTEVPIQ